MECAGGLYAHDRSNPSHKITIHIVNNQHVESRKSEYAHSQLAQADKSHHLIQRLVYLSQKEIEKLISNNYFCSNNLQLDGFHCATTIYGPITIIII